MAGKLTGGSGIKDRIKFMFVGIFNIIFSKLFGVALCSTMKESKIKHPNYILNYYDFIRSGTVELIGREIYEKKWGGAVVELGVWRGDFAAIINQTFPDRKLYLFDTFEGFDNRDIETENKDILSTRRHDFSKTHIDVVLKKMKYPENCIIKKGYFPETAKFLEESFVFVNLDADLYEPIYNGLQFFYPRLLKGGYILVHEYNNAHYTGVKKAVMKYSKEMDIPFFPLQDSGGTAVFMK
jgi:O-methyltransferase